MIVFMTNLLMLVLEFVTNERRVIHFLLNLYENMINFF